MTSHAIRVAAGLTAIGIALTLSSCSAGTKEERGDAMSSESAAEPVVGHNTDDVMFAQLMIPHHEQAVELAALVPERSTNPELIQLAATIAAQQQPEIATLKAMLVQWEVKPDEMPHQGAHGMTMAGMVDEATMVKLEALRGPDFDTLWLKAMVAHHEGAIEMAKVEIADGANVDMIGIARSIVTAQQAEIDYMNRMLAAAGKPVQGG